MDVRGVQQALLELGYNPGPVDGVWGQRSASACAAFQRDQGLTADGIPGPATQAALQAPARLAPGPRRWHPAAFARAGSRAGPGPGAGQPWRLWLPGNPTRSAACSMTPWAPAGLGNGLAVSGGRHHRPRRDWLGSRAATPPCWWLANTWTAGSWASPQQLRGAATVPVRVYRDNTRDHLDLDSTITEGCLGSTCTPPRGADGVSTQVAGGCRLPSARQQAHHPSDWRTQVEPWQGTFSYTCWTAGGELRTCCAGGAVAAATSRRGMPRQPSAPQPDVAGPRAPPPSARAPAATHQRDGSRLRRLPAVVHDGDAQQVEAPAGPRAGAERRNDPILEQQARLEPAHGAGSRRRVAGAQRLPPAAGPAAGHR